MNKNRKTTRYRILAFVGECRTVYVCKTACKDLGAVYRRHTRGRSNATADTVLCKQNALVSLHLLEDITVSYQSAYRHVVAWTRIFAAAGYSVINPVGTREDAADIHPETQILVDLIRREPLDEILRRTAVDIPIRTEEPSALDGDADGEREDGDAAKLTVRMTCAEKENFGAMALGLDMTQRELLLHLLACHAGSQGNRADMDYLKLRRNMERRADMLQEKNEKLERKLERAQASPEARAPAMTKRFTSAKQTVQAYFRLCPAANGRALPSANYKSARKAHAELREYVYRENSDAYIFSPAAILFGAANPPVQFWIGKNAEGLPTRIRIYEKVDFFGVSPKNEKYSRVGVRWLVQTRTAADGAEDLIFALPLPPVKEAPPGEKRGKPSLESILTEIELRHRRSETLSVNIGDGAGIF